TPQRQPFQTTMKFVFTWCSRNQKGLKFKHKGELSEQRKEKGSQEQCPENLLSTNFHQRVPFSFQTKPFFYSVSSL
ncbi:hypothetical protein PHAVU_005G073700, partial [Phaseolus vulgaris]